MTKKGHQKFLWMKTEIWGERSNFFTDSKRCFEKRNDNLK